jgi:hypothetical protein
MWQPEAARQARVAAVRSMGVRFMVASGGIAVRG